MTVSGKGYKNVHLWFGWLLALGLALRTVCVLVVAVHFPQAQTARGKSFLTHPQLSIESSEPACNSRARAYLCWEHSQLLPTSVQSWPPLAVNCGFGFYSPEPIFAGVFYFLFPRTGMEARAHSCQTGWQ